MNLVARSAVVLVKEGFTAPQLFALRYAWHEGDGSVYAGKNNVTRSGSLYTVNASTIRALARQGYLTPFIHADGGMGARLTDRGRDVARVLEPIRGAGR